MKKYPLIQLPGLDAIEAERDEVIVNPNGVAYQIDGKKHAQGGTKMLAEPGSFILSEHLKLDPGVVENLGYSNPGRKKVSPADLARKSPTEKWADILQSNDRKDRKYDELAKKTAALMFSKNSARHNLIYEAQESLKAKKGMRNDLDSAILRKTSGQADQFFRNGGRIKAQTGIQVPPLPDDTVPPDLSAVDQMALNNPEIGNLFKSPLVNRVNTRPVGWSENVDGVDKSFWRPFANDPYFDVAGDILAKGSKNLTAKERKILGERQQRLSSIRDQFPGAEGLTIEKEFAKYLKAADQVEQDKYIDKFVILNGQEIPLSSATEAQIDQASGFRYLNKRTGKNDIVDYRDRQNQGFDPILTMNLQGKKLDTTNLPIRRGNLAAPEAKPILPDIKTISPEQFPGETRKGIDWQSIINGTQIGLMATDLANTRTKPPYYDYRPSELAYTRFEPINTKQQERAFNIARQSIENSSLPQQAKNAQIANLYGTMVEGVNQIDLANYQGKLANDNANIGRFNQMRNTDILREQDATMRYVAEADRRNYLAAAQRQEYLGGIMDIWRNHVNNRRDIGLVNQFSRNFDYDFNSQQVQYQPGQGNLPDTSRLAGFQQAQAPAIDPKFLNEEGKKAFGYR